MTATTQNLHGGAVRVICNDSVTARGGGDTIRWRADGALFAIEGTPRNLREARAAWTAGAKAARYGGTTVPITDDEVVTLAALGVDAPVLAPSFQNLPT